MPTDEDKNDVLIDEYVNLQRIRFASDRDKEIDYQLAVIKAKLRSRGIAAETFDTQH